MGQYTLGKKIKILGWLGPDSGDFSEIMGDEQDNPF
jgi:hypothetical protein